jgi:hypothetical protein
LDFLGKDETFFPALPIWKKKGARTVDIQWIWHCFEEENPFCVTVMAVHWRSELVMTYDCCLCPIFFLFLLKRYHFLS